MCPALEELSVDWKLLPFASMFQDTLDSGSSYNSAGFEPLLICIADRYFNLVLDPFCNANTGYYMGVENGFCAVGHNGYLCKAEKILTLSLCLSLLREL